MEDNLKKAFDTLGVKTDMETDSNHTVIDGENKLSFKKAVVIGITKKHNVEVIDRLDKAALFTSISDIVADFFIEKTGKEIKEKIKVAKDYDDTEAQSSLVQANEIANKLTKKPTGNDMIGDYELRGTKMKFGAIPPMYSWDDIYAEDEKQSQSISYGGIGSKQVQSPSDGTKTTKELMRDYNRHIRNYVECRVQSLLLDTILSNMDDAKKFKLDVKQATALGF